MQNPYEKYKQQSVMTMTQGDMIHLLFDETINSLNKGLACMENKDFAECNQLFKKAQNIVSHLSATMNPEYAISQNLSSLYEYFIYQIVQANIKKEPEGIQEILPMLAELQEAFAQADKQVRMESHG